MIIVIVRLKAVHQKSDVHPEATIGIARIGTVRIRIVSDRRAIFGVQTFEES